MGWFSVNETDDEQPPGEEALLRIRQGQEIHERARCIRHEGVFAGKPAKTAALMKDRRTKLIFEAAFEVDGYAARADMLKRMAGGFGIIEVKSSLHNDKKAKRDLIDDLAYTTMVLRRAGVKIVNAELLLLSKDWRLGKPDKGLFVASDHTKAVLARADEFDESWTAALKAVSGRKMLAARPVFACKHCDFSQSHCIWKRVRDPIFELPRLSEKKFDALAETTVLTIRGIPADFELTAPQERVRTAVVTGKPWLERAALKKLLAEVSWPAFYLDFESVSTALPLWPGVAPHEQVLTQYSVHVCGKPGKVKVHKEFLADPNRDCRRELAERLLADTKGRGSVIVYSGFEKSRIKELAAQFPKLAKALKALLKRLFDLERVFKQAYYHPDFRGKSSIKKTLPVMIPGMDYEGLEIGDGGEAVAAFARMAEGACDAAEEAMLRNALLAYCGQDTLAMVKLHEVAARLGIRRRNGCSAH